MNYEAYFEKKHLERYSTLVLRAGLALLFIWFGLSQLISTESWLSWVPEWAPTLLHIDASNIVVLNGSFEIIAGAFLAFGLWVRIAALLLALHLLVIVFDIGFTAIGMRDLAIAFATFSLALHKPDQWTIDVALPD